MTFDLETQAYRCFASKEVELDILVEFFKELGYERIPSDDTEVYRIDWLDADKNQVIDAKFIVKKDDFKICYLLIKSDNESVWKRIANRIIKSLNGDCLVLSRNPSHRKWIFSSLSQKYSDKFSETRNAPLEFVSEEQKIQKSFLEFFRRIEANEDDVTTTITRKISDAFDNLAIQIKDSLTVNVYDALKILSEGIIEGNSTNLYADGGDLFSSPRINDILKEIRAPIFILLYRIIFILYAEDRGIFRVDNKIYHEEFSLKWIKEEWILKADNTKLAEYQVQKRLMKLFKLIEFGSEAFSYPKEEFSMRSYYGRLFDSKINSKLDRWKISNSHLIQTLKLLTRTTEKNSGKENHFFFDYSALETRHLGSIYESLLEHGHLHVENKKIAELPNPEERKASASYYTPKYIVDYIVKNAIEPLIDKIISENPDKETQFDKILQLKILDPAMGSGHFLVGAVEYIAKRLCKIKFGETYDEKFYIEQKRDVVRSCIYGVDINPLAVDLASLSLWLETLSSEKPLSFLQSHLKCGNSLVGSEIESIFGNRKNETLFENQEVKNAFKKNIKNFIMFEDLEDDTVSKVRVKLEEYSKMITKETNRKLQFLLNCNTYTEFSGVKLPVLFQDIKQEIGKDSLPYYSDAEQQKVDDLSIQETFFHWDLEFPHIFYDDKAEKKSNPGFDVIVGNPPYIRYQAYSQIKPYLKDNYQVYHGSADLFVYFFERALNILKNNGNFGFIASNKWFKTTYAKSLRELVSQNKIEEIIDFGDIQIFKNATTYPSIIMLKKIENTNSRINVCYVNTSNFMPLESYVKNNVFLMEQKLLSSDGWNFSDQKTSTLLKKIDELSISVGTYVDNKIRWGLMPGLTKAFVINETEKNQIIAEDPKCSKLIKPFLLGKDVERYGIKWNKKYLIFTRRILNIDDYPSIKKHLTQFKRDLTPKKSKDEKGPGRAYMENPFKWYETTAPMTNYKEYESPKIIYGSFVVKPRFTIDYDGYYANNGCFIIPIDDKKLVGILNSKLGWFLIKNNCTQIRGGYQLIGDYFQNIPICHKQSTILEKLVDSILKLNSQLVKETSENETKRIEEEIQKIDNEIDEEVYKLYNITEEERKLIESI